MSSVVFLLVLGSGIALAGEAATPPPAPQPLSSSVVSLDGDQWLLATDPKNVGRDEKWFETPRPEAKPTKVPGIIEIAFPGYDGVAWYWREFSAPLNPHAQGRFLLRFWDVDAVAEVWVNGMFVGGHEDARDPFVLDVTDSVKPQAVNRVAVRVVNLGGGGAANQGIKRSPLSPGSAANFGGICDSVELLVAPAIRVEDLFVRADPKTGLVRVQANLRNAGKQAAAAQFVLTVAPAVGGETLQAVRIARELPPGDTVVESELRVANPRLWNLDDPWLYRVTARVSAEGGASDDERSTRCGFRDFRFEDGYFRLNGQRIFLKSSHSGSEVPVGLYIPVLGPGMHRQDIVNCKALRMNMFRAFSGLAPRLQIELCDEIGMLVYQENLASCHTRNPDHFPRIAEAMIKRDRNHPSIVIWGLLNEVADQGAFAAAAASLPALHKLDDTRVIFLNSGSDHGSDKTFANPGVSEWLSLLSDVHCYPRLPATATFAWRGKPAFVSEGGIGSAVNLARVARHYEQIGCTNAEDAVLYRRFLDQFMADWERWKMADTFANPEDYFQQCLAWMAPVRKLGLSAIRSNPNIVGYSLSGTLDQGFSGEGLISTIFRELKPGVVDAMFDAYAPLRWCLFVRPVQLYRGGRARLEAVLVNEDMLAPGEYPARFQVVGPRGVRVFDRTIQVNIADPKTKPEPKFAIPVFSEDVAIDGPSGKYRFLATFEKGAAAAGGEVVFHVTDPADMPGVETEVVLWGGDEGLAEWLRAVGIKTRPFALGGHTGREVILAGRPSAVPIDADAWRELARHIARGSHAVFLSPSMLDVQEDVPKRLPLEKKGKLAALADWLYHADLWAKKHPIFEGLPAGCVLDYDSCPELISYRCFSGLEAPAEVVAAVIDSSLGYNSGLAIAVYDFGAGRFTINTLRIAEALGKDPVAERLLRNMLRHAARDAKKPLAGLPADFDQQLKTLGY